MTEQRREHVRVQSQLPIRIQRLLDGGEPTGSLDTFVLDVSGGGLRIAGPAVFEVGDSVRFELTVPESGDRIEGRARVVRHVFARQRELLRLRAEREAEAGG